MRTLTGILVLALLPAALAAGCGDDEETTAPIGDDGTTATTGAGDPQPIDVAAALEAPDGSQVLVTGHLIALPDGTAELCGGPILESAPPQCGDPALPVVGLEDPSSVPGVTEVGGWAEGDVVLAGVLDDGRLRVEVP